jgi:hypothetical protein
MSYKELFTTIVTGLFFGLLSIIAFNLGYYFAGSDVYKPQYKIGECFASKAIEFERSSVIQINQIGKTDYAFSYYDSKYKEYLTNLSNIEHLRFKSLENVYPNKVNCPVGTYHVFSF